MIITSLLVAGQIGATQQYPKGAVVSDQVLASQIGAEILQRGGNAIDAAVATGFALAVTFPAAGNIGGGGFMVYRSAKGETFALDYREIAPASAFREMYLDKKGELTPDSYLGHRASGVPGTVAGFYAAHQKYGKLPWKDLIQPSVRLASQGFKINAHLADDLKDLAEKNKQFKGTWRIFGRSGQFYKGGETFRQPELAKTLTNIRDQGAQGFYAGETAKAIVQEMDTGNGLITEKDLRNYEPTFRQVMRGKYKGYEVLTMPPPSSGGVVLLMMLGMIEKDDLKTMGFNSSGTVHLMTETMKRCFADRAEYMGDPGFVQVPTAKLLDSQYLLKRRKEINPNKAMPAEEIKPGLGKTNEKEHTTHFSVVDAEGNAVSNTYTLNDGYGSKVTVGEAGFLLNNEMDDFTSKPGSPNQYNLIQGEANTIKPGKRPLSSMTPTILTKDGKLFLVLGSPGGPTIINTVFETILNVTVHGMSVQKAVSAPRFHHQWLPDEIRMEPFAMSNDTIALLKSKGHKFRTPAGQGSCQAILVGKDGIRQVGCDPRISSAGQAGY
jgi:gamma-glutamyltranspeptidase/glutathione hydrolase